MGKCRHCNVTGAIVVRMFAAGGAFADGYLKECAAHFCQDCGAWLSLGPSNDADPRAAVEIMASDIATRAADWDRGDRVIENGIALSNIGGPKTDAARLAREIYEHNDTEGGQ